MSLRQRLPGGGQGYGRGTPAVGNPTSGKANSHREASLHPGVVDRMIGDKKTTESGKSSPKYVGGRRGSK